MDMVVHGLARWRWAVKRADVVADAAGSARHPW
jgi:hypothetical protein